MLILIVLNGALVWLVSALLLPSAPVFAAVSASSFPVVPRRAFIHTRVHVLVFQLRFSRASAASSAICDLKSMLLSAFSAACDIWDNIKIDDWQFLSQALHTSFPIPRDAVTNGNGDTTTVSRCTNFYTF